MITGWAIATLVYVLKEALQKCGNSVTQQVYCSVSMRQLLFLSVQSLFVSNLFPCHYPSVAILCCNRPYVMAFPFAVACVCHKMLTPYCVVQLSVEVAKRN